MSRIDSVARAVRRLVRQEKSDDWAVRLLPRLVLGLAGAYTLFILASSSMSSFITICALLVLGLLVFLLRRRGQLLLALGSTVLTAAFAGYLAAVADIARGIPAGWAGGQAVFGHWALAGMALLGTWVVKEHPGRRGLTVVLADVVLLVAAGIGTVAPPVAVPLGFVGIVAVLMFRGGGGAAVGRFVRRLARRPAPDTKANSKRV
ncbi:hypothetical protein Q5762_08520 [Streptomyces sp. P9(2023)]|uniref:hypothetical protein n=1 Tax=Streptomyces sp. P9(2023) TaxID=3064394 RepID=UPI0028F43B02|nr:hypothetical protein [Streptomyces sp. P9(2023)]MDT9688399.1 hypothetical protein [Streptomyces sp. P9(2023)]